MLQKLLIALVSAVVLSTIISVIAYTPISERLADSSYTSFGGLMLLNLLYSVPVFAIGGVSASYLIEKLVAKISLFDKYTYFPNFLLYALAGVLVGFLFLIVISKGGQIEHGFSYGPFLLLCIAGAIVFYHLLIFTKKFHI